MEEKKSFPSHRVGLGCLLLSAFLASGCVVTPKVLTVGEMEKQRSSDLDKMFGPVAKIDRPLSLADVVARSLRYNLDHRVKVVEEAQALDLTKLDKFELLPKLAASSAYSGRSNFSASNSRSMLTGEQSLEVSTSQDRDHTTADLDLTWNILDFGVGYFNARQNADRQLIARERERKVIQNLVQESRAAYWRVVAAQELRPRVEATIKLAEEALNDAKNAQTSELRSPLDFLRYRKTLLESVRQLESILQEMGTAKVELAAMMTLPPGTDYTLEVPGEGMQAPVWTVPLDKMEEMALLDQPDMREMGYQGRIVVDESRKSLLKLFPGITFSASRKHDSNSYTLNKDWYETGIRVSWNLLSLLSAPDQMAYNESSERVLEIKRLALRMALLSQVHVAYRQFDMASTQLRRSKELYHVEKEIAEHMQNRAAQEAQSLIDRISSDTSAILAELRYYHALAQAHGALGRVMATTGQDPDVAPIQGGALADLTKRVSRWLDKYVGISKVSTGSEAGPSPVAVVPKVPGEISQAEGQGQTGTVNGHVRVRGGPGTNYDTLRVLSPGTTLTVYESDSGGRWSRVGEGEWVASRWLTLSPAVSPAATDSFDSSVTTPPDSSDSKKTPLDVPETNSGAAVVAPDSGTMSFVSSAQ